MKSTYQRHDGITHGTYYGYTHFKCRCDECRRANTESCARRKAERIARGITGDVAHGSPSTYSNWGCRCEPCTRAWSESIDEMVRAWQKANPEKVRESNRAYYHRNREAILVKRRAARAAVAA